MKKCFTFFVVMLVLMAGVFAAGFNREKIDKFLKDYEAYVEAYEDAVDSENLKDLMDLSKKSLEMTEACNEIQNLKGWTLKDAEKLLKLEERLAEAIDDEDDEAEDDDEECEDYDVDDYMNDLKEMEALYNFSF